MRRPSGIILTTGLLAIALIGTVPVVLAGRMAHHWSETQGLTAFTLHTFLLAVLALLVVGGLAVVLWFYFHGRNWARWAVFALCLVCFLPLRGMPDRMGSSHIRMAVIFYRAVTAAIVLLYNLTPAARAWFASEPSIDE